MKDIPKFKVGDLVLLGNLKKHAPWFAKYMSFFCICKVINDMTLDLQEPSDHIYHASLVDIYLFMLVE